MHSLAYTYPFIVCLVFTHTAIYMLCMVTCTHISTNSSSSIILMSAQMGELRWLDQKLEYGVNFALENGDF